MMMGVRGFRGALTVLVAAVAPAWIVSANAFAPQPVVPAASRTYYVDCSRPGNGEGSIRAPFNSLASVNALRLEPGDRVRFRRGSVCQGGLAPRGNGAPGRPLVITAYGKGAQPAIRALAPDKAAVTLTNISHVLVEDLALTNPSGSSADIRNGLLVNADSQLVQDVVVQRLDVRDVVATIRNQENKAGGIVFVAMNGGRFHDITIRANTVANLQNAGIAVNGGGSDRPAAEVPWPSASTGILITGNFVTRVTGNGIFVSGSYAPVSSYNRVSYAAMANRDFRDRTNHICNVGLWFFNTNNALAEYNEVSHTVHRGPDAVTSGCDGEAFDIDYNQDGTVFQYNYSHDNEGSFILFCATRSPHRGAVRYNLSINDESVYSAAPCEVQLDPKVNNLDGIQMYNNVFIAAAPKFSSENDAKLARQMPPFLGNFEFRNNIIYATGPVPADTFFECGRRCTNNLYHGMAAHGTDAVIGDPEFVNPNARGEGLGVVAGFRLRSGSPALCRGTPIPAAQVPMDGARDRFGAIITTPPSIGLHQPPCRLP